MRLGVGYDLAVLRPANGGETIPPVVASFVVSISSGTSTTVYATVDEACRLRIRYRVTSLSTPPSVWPAWGEWTAIPDPWTGAVGLGFSHTAMDNLQYMHVQGEIEDAAGNPAADNPQYGSDRYEYIPEG